MPNPKNYFYNDIEYRKKQSIITKENWKNGIYDYKIKPQVLKHCKNKNCSNTFFAKPFDVKVFCSRRCSAIIRNTGRVQSESTKIKISNSVKLLPVEKRGKHFSKPKVKMICLNCKKKFELVPYLSKTQKYCSIHCNIVIQGRKTTSPKASKGKNGVREDNSPNINFYSTWEANIARVYNLVGIKWEYAPKLFDLGVHTYRPDFYLPDSDEYIEVKNFMSKYSQDRDTLFRKKFPSIKLHLILKPTYLAIASHYRALVDNWEN